MKLENPYNYKTQNGLIKKLSRIHESCTMTGKVAMFLHNAKFCLIEKFGWGEKEASKFVACYHPNTSSYTAAA